MSKPIEGPYEAWLTDVPYAEFGGAAWTVQADLGSVCVVDCPKDEAAATARLLANSWEMREALEQLLIYAQDEHGHIDPDSAGQMVGVMQDGTLTLKGSFIAQLTRARALLAEIDGEDQ